MLLHFSAENFKSFKDELSFSMEPALRQKGLDYSILKKEREGKCWKALCSGVIYGPNASGKTSIIHGLDTLRRIVLRGNIHDEKSFAPGAPGRPDLIPNSQLEMPKPVHFSIRFISSQKLFDYDLRLDLGSFLSHQPGMILEESLSVDNHPVFSRVREELMVLKRAGKEENREVILNLARKSLNPSELFLTNGFKNIADPALTSEILSWFEHQLIPVYTGNEMDIPFHFPGEENFRNERTDSLLGALVKEWGITDHEIIVGSDESIRPRFLSRVWAGNQNCFLPAEWYESEGTLRILKLLPFILYTLKAGAILFVDNLDAFLHPMAVMNLINIFHNDELNINQAQLVFTSHDPVYLDASLFRRDEIHLVERDDCSGSTHYTLADFKTSKYGVRKGEDYLTQYLANKYGGIREIHLENLVEEFIKLP